GLQFRPRLRESVIRALVHTAHHLHFGQLAVDHASFRRHRLRYREADLEVEGVARSTMMVAEHRAGDPDALTRDGLDQFRDRVIHVLRYLAAGYTARYHRRCDLCRSDDFGWCDHGLCTLVRPVSQLTWPSRVPSRSWSAPSRSSSLRPRCGRA